MQLRYLGILLALGISANGADAPFRNGSDYRDDLHEVSMRDLDGLPIALPLAPIEFPASLKSTGYIGDLWVTAAVKPDGTVESASAYRGNNRAFEIPVNKAVMGWRFTRPQKGGRDVAAFLQLHVVVSETSTVQVTLEDHTSNKSTDPTLASGTPGAGHQPRHP
jgi:hypothetical protein